MVDAVNIVSVQNNTSRLSSQRPSVFVPVTLSAPVQLEFTTSHIRVDNLQNVAILEYLSSNGEVVRQYPSQAQISAFKRAEQLQTVPQSSPDTDSAPQIATAEPPADAPAPPPAAPSAPSPSVSGGTASPAPQSILA